jgi:hypothetical protein
MGLFDIGKKALKIVSGTLIDSDSNVEDSQNNEPTTAIETVNDSNTITDIDQLESKLKDYSQTLSKLSNETNNKIVLANSLKAQLEVINAAKNPTLCKSAFDLMLQALNDAAEEIDDDKELRNIQKRAALMTNNMIFFFDAYLCYKENKQSKEGQALLSKACDTLATTANGIFDDIKNNPFNIGNIPFVASKQLFSNIIKDGWFNKILDFIFKARRIEELRNSYYDFLISVIDKLKRYTHLFGRSLVLAEMINNKKEAIAIYAYPEPLESDNYASVILWPTLSILVIIIILFIILGIVKLINLTPANLDKTVKSLWTAIKYSAIAEGVALIVTAIINIIRKISYKASVKRCLKHRNRVEANCTEIAELFYS